MVSYFLISLFFPLISSIFAGVFSFYKKSQLIGIVCSSLIIISTISSIFMAEIVIYSGPKLINLGEFIKVENLNINFSFLVDALTIIMMSVVGIVASVVHVYSIGYMENDDKFNKFFSFLGLFVFSMLFLVSSENFVGLFIGWEGVGLCSWLLIGFWYDKKGVSWCANEAFIMNRISDLGMLIAIFLIYINFNSISYLQVFQNMDKVSSNALILICLTLFIGAMGKSAQFPFHTWLADAMAGPTPVSALIHAATMVTAGVYLIARANFLFIDCITANIIITYIGAFTAIFAATIATVCNDLKKIIAYSTLSQLGYMFVAIGLGAYWIAIFHLFTHAFFKSLLFLCAGNIMHATNDELNVKKMGGMYPFMKYTAIFMIIGSVALCGIYPFAGFFSKDKILELAFFKSEFIVWFVLLTSAVFTAFYSFRLIMLVFFTEKKLTHKPHESKNYMLISLAPLVLLSIFSGFLINTFKHTISKSLPIIDINLTHNTEIALILITTLVILSTIVFTIFIYKKDWIKLEIDKNFIIKVLKNNYFIPQIYDKILIKPYYKISDFCYKIDTIVIDKSVDLIAKLIIFIAKFPAKMQTNNLSIMLKTFVLGFIFILILILL